MRRCYGYHIISCNCGGDLCVCGRDGDECMGCQDCHEDDADDYNPDACPECGSDEGNAPICSVCGYLLLDDDD